MSSSTGQPPPHSATTINSSAVGEKRNSKNNVDDCKPSTSKMTTTEKVQKVAVSNSNPISKRFDRKSAIRQVYSFFLDALITNTVVKCHRDISLNEAVGLNCKNESEMPVTPSLNPYNGPSTSNEIPPSSSSKKQIECICYTCKRVIAASRLAPHLEKCIGLGRNSSRVARKRLATYTTSAVITSSSASSSPRVRQVSNTTIDTDAMEAESVGDLDDADWSAQSLNTPPKRRRTHASNGNSSSRGDLLALPPPTRSSSRFRHR
ncbi:SAGA-associated factor 11 [Aphelenchoides besseyi]|nr:SAGA-associated factor 11 [Aphelenchoides besseyi]